MRSKTLHITNGDATASLLKAAGIDGDLLPWRDVLHDGPVPGGLGLAELSRVRADYLSEAFPRSAGDVHRDFIDRDARLARCDDYDEVVLWFEHDLYDQLQILQLFDWLGAHPPQRARCTLVCIDRFPGIEPFHGLGQLSPAQIATLLEKRQAIAPRQLDVAARGWQAFTHDDPTLLIRYRDSDLGCLPFMRNAVARWLEEFPCAANGLSRTQAQILEIVAGGESRPGRVFVRNAEREQAPYMGDWSVWLRIADLCSEPEPLMVCEPAPFRFPTAHPADEGFRAQRLSITNTGRDVLARRADRLQLHPIDTWLGGVHLSARTASWRWDREKGDVVLEDPRP